MSKKPLYFNEIRQATWLELFFDLIFVVALGKITHLLSHVHDGHLSHGVWLKFVLLFIPLWWIWIGHTTYSNRFDADERPHRVATLLLMFLLILFSVLIDQEMDRNFHLFAGVYVGARLLIAGFYFNAAKSYPDKKGFCIPMGRIYAAGAFISLSAVFFELPLAAFVFYAGILFDIFVPLILKKKIVFFPVDKDHLVERVGLLAIILLGESIISLSNGITSVSWQMQTIVTASTGFVLLGMIWWIYFDSFPFLTESKKDPNGTAIMFSQLLTYMALAVMANTIRHAILNDLNLEEFRVMAITGMLLFYCGKQTAYWVNIPEYRYYNIRNTIITFVIAGASLFLEQAQHILLGMAFSMMVYIIVNYQAQIKLYGKAKM